MPVRGDADAVALRHVQCGGCGPGAFEDEDIRPISIAVGMLADGDFSKTSEEHFRLPGSVYPKFPVKSTKQKALLWPWLELTVGQGDVADAMARNLGDLPIERIFRISNR